MQEILALAIALIGLAIILGGGKALKDAGKLTAGCLVRLALFLIVIVIGYQFLVGYLPNLGNYFPPGGSMPQFPGTGGTSGQGGAGGQAGNATVFLRQYPVLSQLDPNNYREKGYEGILDTAVDGRQIPLSRQACLATVYTILERGRGNAGATIDDIYPDPRKQKHNTDGPSAPSYVSAQEALDLDAIVDALDANRPTILRGVGGPLGQHFVLAVGYGRNAQGAVSYLVANDPWPETGTTAPGRQLRIDVTGTRFEHPDFGFHFTHMRRVAP